MLTQEQLKEKLSYNQETGDFTWLVGRKMAGKIAGTENNKGYLRIAINKKKYLAHRLAWLYVYGKMPAEDIDHINGLTHINCIKNLRECTDAENQWNAGIARNNTSGFKGVSWNKNVGKWRAQICIANKELYLGAFETAELASAAYNAKAKEIHGEFYRTTNRTGKL